MGKVEEGRRTRIALTTATLLSSAVVTFTAVPVRVLPSGSQGSDPGGRAVVFESLNEFLQAPSWVVLVIWVVLGAAGWYRNRLIGGDALRWVLSVVAPVLALACLLFGGWGYWLSLTAYQTPQMGEGAYNWWLLSSAAIIAIALGVRLLPIVGPAQSLRIVGAMATAFVPSVAALLVVGYRVQTGAGLQGMSFPVAAGAMSATITVVLFGLVLRLWGRAEGRDRPSSILWLNRTILVVGTVFAMFWLILLVFTALFVGGGISVVEAPLGPLLFAVISYLPLASHSDLALPAGQESVPAA